MDTRVLIVGAGPTGLALAGELMRRKVDCILIDSLEGPLHWDRATVVHPRTLELLDTVGLADELVEAGVSQRHLHIYSDGERLGEMDLAESGSEFGFNLNVSEEVTESVLTGHLERQGGSVRQGHRLTAMRQEPDRVVATVEHSDEVMEIEAEWVVGCGGLHSPVRELSGIEFEGHDIATPWAVFDVTLTGWPHGYDCNFAFLDRDPVIITALPGERWRAYVRPAAPDSDLVGDAAAVITRYGPGVSLDDVANPTRFHCHTKVAARYREGRALLAGDAAHVVSPSQGHGMNTGIQDSFNLAWKMAMVCHGHADASLLDSYEAERRPVARRVAASGDDFESAQGILDEAGRGERNGAIRDAYANEESRRQEVLAEAELNISYAGSPIVIGGEPVEGPGAGDRFVDPAFEMPTGFGHTLLVVAHGEDLAAEAVASLDPKVSRAFESTVTLGPDSGAPDRLGVEVASFFAIRPDGHVGCRSDGAGTQPIEDYVDLLRAGGRGAAEGN